MTCTFQKWKKASLIRRKIRSPIEFQ